MRGICFLNGTLLALAVAVCAPDSLGSVFPRDGWTGAKVVRESNGELSVKDPSGRRTLLRITAEPHGSDCIRYVTASNRGDRIDLYTRAAFARGMIKLVTWGEDVDVAPLRGRLCTVRTTWSGVRGSEASVYVMGQSKSTRNRYFHRELRPLPNVRTYDQLVELPADYERARFRLDVRAAGGGDGPVSIHRAEIAPTDELPPNMRPAYGTPELLLHVPFDGTAEAAVGKGGVKPLAAKGLEFVPGRRGQAVRFSRRAKSDLRYAFDGNVIPEHGTVAMWIRREWPDDGKDRWRDLFSFEPMAKGNPCGAGRVALWWINDGLRFDQRDIEDAYQAWPRPFDPKAGEKWMHVAATWDRFGVQLYVNGLRRWGNNSDGTSPFVRALATNDPHSFFAVRGPFSWLQVGGAGGASDGLVDDLRVYSAPLSPAEVRALYRRDADPLPPYPDYAKLYAGKANRYEAAPAEPSGVPGRMELVESVRLDEAGVAALRRNGRFRSVGGTHFGSLKGDTYLETDGTRGTRFAVRFNLPTNAPLYCFEIDYPDDAKRTMDIIVQDSQRPFSDYRLQCGVLAGGEYPNTGRMLTHRCLYWVHAADCALVAMAARPAGPAAIAAIRVYRVADGTLPAARVTEPKGVPSRLAALYFEDPAIGYDFAVCQRDEDARDPAAYGEHIDRVAAYMKYCGLNTLCYPGAWYHGLMGDDYMPRPHPRDFLNAYYEKFDREGLSFLPTVHGHTMPGPDGRVSVQTMSDGSLHDTVFSIFDTGKPNWGGWHGTPPNYNFAHPDVQAFIEKTVMTLVEQGAPHPSFKGVVLHMTEHAFLWFGPLSSGYNDYAIDRFVESLKGLGDLKGLRSLEAVDRKAPLRGREYARIIRGDPGLRAKWVAWRCETVAGFYGKLAAKMRARRPDLKLWFNAMAGGKYEELDLSDPDFANRHFREFGFDHELLTARVPNAVMCRTIVPADYRRGNPNLSAAAVRHSWERDGLEGFYPIWKNAAFPVLNHHDRYWEDAVGRTGSASSRLSGDWLNETGWRVSTLNPSGRNALRHFSLPLSVHDVLGVSKGGFLMGFYGMEDMFVPWIRAFRALPAVVFDDLPTANAKVKVRTKDVGGRRYFYAVNATETDQSVTIRLPRQVRDLVTGERLTGFLGGEATIRLQPYELKSFATPE